MKKPRIMIVGGDDAVIYVLRGELEGAGYEVYWQRFGKDALAKLKIAEFSLVVVHSVWLPDIDAAELISQITSSAPTMQPIHVILCSGADTRSPEFTKKYRDAGVDEIIQGPYEIETLLAAIHDFVTVS